MPFVFKGKEFDAVPRTQMSPDEIEEVEAITGCTYQKLDRMERTCICEHPMAVHEHRDKKQKLVLTDTSCGSADCDCPGFVADVPIRVHAAYCYIALKRVDAETTYADVSGVPQSEWKYKAAADPTQPLPEG